MDSVMNISVVTDVLYPVFRKYDIRRAILFGSVAKGTATKESDLDICVDSNLKGLRFLGFLEEVKQSSQQPYYQVAYHTTKEIPLLQCIVSSIQNNQQHLLP